MDEQIKALVAIGASAAVNCRPCLAHHLEACERLGIDRADVQTAAEIGLMVARGAASKTRDYVGEIIGYEDQTTSKDQKRDSLRRDARVPAQTDGAPERLVSPMDTEDKLLRDEMSACVAEFLFRLPSPQRDVVALHDMAGLKHKEIAAQLDISESNSRVLLHRGRAALKVILSEGCVLALEEDSVPCERKQDDSCKPEGRTDESFDGLRASKP